MPTELSHPTQEPEKRLAQYPLLESLLARRSRRFGKGMSLNGGPLAYESTQAPEPLSLEEEAALGFAACGITGYTMAELPYNTGMSLRQGVATSLSTSLAGRPSALMPHIW